ncbi:hypothetical protein APHAL10511_001183 [Amanita phalloides]|nr:hypothetical protein APHAL10511_001183 [Amanita phalloides]
MRVAPLSLLCVELLSRSPHELHRVFGKLRLNWLYSPPAALTDPCLWASFVQIYNHLPPTFISFSIHLLHLHLPLLQSIPQTPYFSLITLLDLPDCRHVTDAFARHLLHLHSLVALDISRATVSCNAIKHLAQTLTTNLIAPQPSHGPWPLRILRLHGCKNIDNTIFPYLLKFPLLCVLDLRGTQCILRPTSLSLEWTMSEDPSLFFPFSLSYAIDRLVHSAPRDLWSSPTAFRLLIDRFTNSDEHDNKSQGLSQLGAVSTTLFYAASSHPAVRKQQTEENAQLMLYRKPPPWGNLHEAIQSAGERGTRRRARPERVVAIRGGRARQAALEKLQQDAMRRKQSTGGGSRRA